MSNQISPDEIRQSVRDRYADLARTPSSCCGPSACDCNSNYPDQLANAVPEDIANFSLGCGDPITIANLQPGETVVDLGSGGGLDCFFAAQRVGPAGHVVGVDMTAEMLAKARGNAERLGVTNVEFREGYIERLPVADGEADVVISNCVVNLSPDKPQVFRDIFRALRSGGRISISDIVTNGELPAAIQADMEAWGACVAGALDVKDYIGGLLAAGFVDIKVEPKGKCDAGLSLMPVHEPFSALITARKP
jgi:arsenite methyltransferase